MKYIYHYQKKLLLRNLKRYYRWANGDRSELKKITITIQCIWIAIVGALMFTLIDAIFGLLSNMIADIFLVLSFIGAYFLINKNYMSLGKLLVFIAGNGILFLNASCQGRESGNFFIFFPIITCIFALFSFKERRYIFLCLAITLSNFLFLEATDYSYLKSLSFPLSYQYPNYLTSFFISSAMVGYFSYYYSKANTATEKRLKKVNARLKAQNLKLTKTNNELDSFVYKASHDLRAPLSSLLGLIEVSRLESNLENLKNYAHLQVKLIRKLDLYIMDMLDFSRNTNVEIQLKQINFEVLIKQSLEQLQYLENFHSIEKKIDISEGQSLFFADEKRVSIILNNLLSNAIRYADLSKEKSYLSIKIVIDSNQALIECVDNGIGIDTVHLGKIFKMFYRAVEHSSGSGLGLYIVEQIIEKLGGKIKVSSQKDKWTRFEICIPNNLPTRYLTDTVNKIEMALP